jgi:glycosyltransferase involved in cell wall biosynthesis
MNSVRSVSVAIFEPNPFGHRLGYVEQMVEGLLEIGVVPTLILTNQTVSSKEYEHTLGKMEQTFSLRTVSMPPLPKTRSDFRGYAKAFLKLRCLDDFQFIYLPTADGLAQFLGLANRRPMAYRQRSIIKRTEALLFGGRFGYSKGLRAKIRLLVSSFCIDPTSWRGLFHVDPYQQKTLSQLGEWGIMPDPVADYGQSSIEHARNRFGLNLGDFYFGTTGWIEKSKGCDLLIEAFASSVRSLPPNCSLFLAGPVFDGIDSDLMSKYSHLVRDRRIVLKNELLNEESMRLAIQAADVVCLPYRRTGQSSSIFIKSVAHYRPIIAPNSGWLKETMALLNNGWTYLDGNLDGLKQAMESAARAERNSIQIDTPRIRKFIDFHSAKNFQLTWTRRLREHLGIIEDNMLHRWESVLQ